MEKQHVCEVCNASFLRKQSLIRHLNKTRKCNATDFKCNWCSKSFSTSSNLSRHINNCSVKRTQKELEQKIQADTDTMYARLKELEEKYKLLEANMNKKSVSSHSVANGIKISGNHNSTTINPVTTTNNITINKYGCEDMSHFTLKKITFVFDRGFRSVLECVKLKHFSPLAPQNRNVRITNWNNNGAYIFSGSNWDIISRNKLIDEMYEDICEYIADNLEEHRDSLSDQVILKIQKFLDDKDEEETMKKIKEELRELIYNERNHPLYNCTDL
jgi:uncharacterized C2H2 Zn-finger protein